MANDKCTSSISSKCTVCGDKFANIQECLKHELIKHSLQKKSSQHNRIQKKLNTTAKLLNSGEKILERERLKSLLHKCESGQEIPTIFEMFCMKPDNLSLIFTRIQTCLEKELRSAGILRVYPFGSIASGLALRDCDIDVFMDVSNALTSPTHKHDDDKFHQKKVFNRIDGLLHRSSHFSDVFAIRRARVPIIKCKHNDTGFSIDINVSWPSSQLNTQFIYDLCKSDERIHEVILFLKLWAKNIQVVGRDKMSSYCLITMVIFFLQQPRKSGIETTGFKDYRILKSIKELQTNCHFRMVQGINYAYDLNCEDNKPKISDAITTWDLIKEFFDFYQNFDFEDYIISPYYGISVAKTSLTSDIDYYKQLRTITQHLKGEEASNLQIDRCMCVQDAFCLNQNTAKNMSPLNKQYFLLCIRNARKICENQGKLKLGQLYDQLLYETINMSISQGKEKSKAEIITDLKNLKLPMPDLNEANNNEGILMHTVLPSKADVRAVSSHFPDKTTVEEILRCWCQHYLEGIAIFMTKLYHIDMQKPSPNQQKQLKQDNDEKEKEFNQSWLISCSVDLWSNRFFQKQLQTTFMAYQLEQTEHLYAIRRQDPKYSVTLNAVLKLNILRNYKGIDIQLELAEGSSVATINKKNPLRKFFNAFKNTLQHCNFKDLLNIVVINAKNG